MNLVLTALLLLQDSAAEETFRKLEERFEKATSLKVTFTMELTENRKNGNETFSASGEFLVKEGGRLFTKAAVHRPDQKKETIFISDGKRMMTLRNDEPFGEPQPTFQNLTPRMTVGFLRGGLFGVDHYFRHRRADQPIGPAETDVRNILGVSEFRTGADDGEARTLSFRCTVIKGEQALDVTLAYEPKTFRILKRTIKPVGQNQFSLAVEKYSDFVLDGEIPDETFKLREEKK